MPQEHKTNSLSQHLYLCGYRGSGKSTVARLLAKKLAVQSCDTDDIVEKTAGTSIKDIFEHEGESGFRDRETEALRLASVQPPQVIALGGGAVLREVNRELIRQTGQTVWLDASAKVLAQRIAGDRTTGDRRPSLTSQGVLEEIQSVLEQREPIYRAASQFRIDVTEQDANSTAGEILRQLTA